MRSHASLTATPSECCPAAVRKGKEGKVPVTMALAREETETALNVCIQHVLDRTGLKPHQVGGPVAAHCRICRCFGHLQYKMLGQ